MNRRFWSTQTLVSTEAVLNATYIRFNESLSAVESIEGLVWALSLQPLPPAFYARNADGNCLGLEDRDGQDLVTVLMSTTWTSEADDAVVEAAAKKLMADIEQDAKALGDWDRYVYLNYASEEQDPIASYGHDNVDRLRRISQRVDPDKIFTHAVPGGFKLW
jgi:FAD/FMN-containing dehydrogenase